MVAKKFKCPKYRQIFFRNISWWKLIFHAGKCTVSAFREVFIHSQFPPFGKSSLYFFVWEGCKLELETSIGWTALDYALEQVVFDNHNWITVQHLLDAGAKITGASTDMDSSNSKQCHLRTWFEWSRSANNSTRLARFKFTRRSKRCVISISRKS